MNNKKNIFLVKEIIFNNKGQILLKSKILARNNNTFFRCTKSKPKISSANKL